MNQRYDVIIAGCGASGMAAAVKAAENKRKVLILEKGDRAGRKILASGNGRCNLMNRSTPRYYGDPDFALQVLDRCPPEAITQFFRHYGLLTTEEDDGRVYPITYQSSSVLSVLKNALEVTGVNLVFNDAVVSAEKNDGLFHVCTEKGECFTAGRFIVSCGGAAQPKLGGSMDGYALLRSFGHSVIPVLPALVPINSDRKSISGLSGIRARCSISLYKEKTCLHREKGEILFTDYGVSGICIMQCARFSVQEKTFLMIDFLSEAFRSEKDALMELARRKEQFSHQSPLVLLNGITQEKISYAILKQAGIPMRGEKAGDLTADDLLQIVRTAFGYHIDVIGTRGFDFAQVSSGGADCREFNPVTMESYIVPGLYATGEVLNVDGDCGGFNLMFAISSGLNAGNSV